MTRLRVLRQSMMKWNLFLTSCIFAAGLLLKAGAPLAGVMLGVGLAAAVNWKGRSVHQTVLERTRDR